MHTVYVKWYHEISYKDILLVGEKNASLGEMNVELSRGTDVNIPDGFVITIDGYRGLLSEDDVMELRWLMGSLDNSKEDFTHQLSVVGNKARQVILKATLPADCIKQVIEAYAKLSKYNYCNCIAVRTSAITEDLPFASFPGQHDSFLNITDEIELMEAVMKCYASLFTDRAICYRMDNGFDHFKVSMSIGIMNMVRSDLACSGVVFTSDNDSGFKDGIYITGSYGLLDNSMCGTVDPDEYYVFKPTFKEGYKSILRRRLGKKETKIVFANDHSAEFLQKISCTNEESSQFCLTDVQALRLAYFAVTVENHYAKIIPVNLVRVDIEWAMDGVDGLMYVTQATPVLMSGRIPSSPNPTRYMLDNRVLAHENLAISGFSIGTTISYGVVRIIRIEEDLQALKVGEVVVADSTYPSWEPLLKRASGIVTNHGRLACHAAMYARRCNLPAIVGTQQATMSLKTGDQITLDCSEGEIGLVLKGFHTYSIESVEIPDGMKLNTKIMINLGDPERAFAVSSLPCDGIGLCRLEYSITERLKVHPMALIHPENIADEDTKMRVQQLIPKDMSGKEFFVQTLVESVGTIAAAFYPRPVKVCLSDFKSNEYSSLLGGKQFEPDEENPMLGFRGASRYTHPLYNEVFELECRAIQSIVYNLGFTNLILLIPFCRSMDEAHKVNYTISIHGVIRTTNTNDTGIEVHMMCGIPSNIILIDKFAEYFDGFLIGSNDLTQLTLGLDQSSSDVFNEKNHAVLKLIEMAIEGAKRNSKNVGICGQLLSNCPDIINMLIRLGIDNVCVAIDNFMMTLMIIQQYEMQALGKKIIG